MRTARRLKPTRRVAIGFISSTIVIAALIVATFPAFGPPIGGRPVEVPSVGPRPEPKPDPESARDQEAARQRQDELVRRIRDQAIKSFPDFNENTASHSIFEGLPDAQADASLRHYLESDPTAQQIGMLTWKFTAAPKLDEIERMLQLARSPLPGHVELGLLLDARVYGDSYKSIVDAWGQRPITETPTNDLLTNYLAGLKGNTLITVGHVEGDAYVVQDANGSKTSVNIKQLLINAHENGVVLIPVGCSTAKAGVGIGFIKEIGTEAVSEFLKTFPRGTPTTADLLNRLFKIGEMRVNIRDAADLFQVQVFDDATESPVSQGGFPGFLSSH
jgi:hypothetical protein